MSDLDNINKMIFFLIKSAHKDGMLGYSSRSKATSIKYVELLAAIEEAVNNNDKKIA